MAEPYDTINAIGSGPVHWWRFQGSSAANIANEGSSGATPAWSEVVAGTSDFTYQHGTNQRGETSSGFAVGSSNSDAGIETASAIGGMTAKGTMMVVVRALSTSYLWPRWCAGVSDNSFDSDMNDFAWENGIDFEYHIQDAGTDDERWYQADTDTDVGADMDDLDYHSIAIVVPTGTTDTPDCYIDGSALSLTFDNFGADNVPNNWWLDNYSGDRAHFGFRNGTGGSTMSDVVIYEFLIWNERLSAAQVQDAHDALFGFVDTGGAKTIRRVNWRMHSF